MSWGLITLWPDRWARPGPEARLKRISCAWAGARPGADWSGDLQDQGDAASERRPGAERRAWRERCGWPEVRESVSEAERAGVREWVSARRGL